MELEGLVSDRGIEPVQFSEWAVPIVSIVKEDKSIRIGSDYKIIINQVTKVDDYLIPRIEDLLSNLVGGKSFRSWTSRTLIHNER